MKRITTLPRSDMHQVFERLNFTFSLSENDLYWREDIYYQFTLDEIEQRIENPTAELHHMCLDFCSEAVKSEEILRNMDISEELFDPIRWSWDSREQDLYGRFDLAYDGNGPAKLLEYNADTPTSIYEAAVLQWEWMESQRSRGKIPSTADQFNSLHEQLVSRLRILPGNFWHFACMDNLEDRTTIEYLADCAAQAGKDIRCILMDQIGILGANQSSVFVDNENKHIEHMFKLYPWEWLVQEEFGKNLYAMNATKWHEPLWKMLLSNKGLLVHLWNKYEGHPNLLPARFVDSTETVIPDGVVKPILGREGADISIIQNNKVLANEDTQSYNDQKYVWQGLAPTRFEDHYTTIGSWLIGNRPSGMGMRENVNPIINNTSQFIPHIILD